MSDTLIQAMRVTFWKTLLVRVIIGRAERVTR
jgi:hypothetical protein